MRRANKLVNEAATNLGISRNAIYYRMALGWSEHEALTLPKGSKPTSRWSGTTVNAALRAWKRP
jgi:hypothetical protein